MIRRTVSIECRGMNAEGNEALETAISVDVRLVRRPANGHISSWPQDCPHNTDGHGQRCKASHPDKDKVGDGVLCPYSFDLPHQQDPHKPKWHVPEVLRQALEEMQNAEEAV